MKFKRENDLSKRSAREWEYLGKRSDMEEDEGNCVACGGDNVTCYCPFPDQEDHFEKCDEWCGHPPEYCDCKKRFRKWIESK